MRRINNFTRKLGAGLVLLIIAASGFGGAISATDMNSNNLSINESSAGQNTGFDDGAALTYNITDRETSGESSIAGAENPTLLDRQVGQGYSSIQLNSFHPMSFSTAPSGDVVIAYDDGEAGPAPSPEMFTASGKLVTADFWQLRREEGHMLNLLSEESQLNLDFDISGGKVTGWFIWDFWVSLSSGLTYNALYTGNLAGTYSPREAQSRGFFHGTVTGSVSTQVEGYLRGSESFDGRLWGTNYKGQISGDMELFPICIGFWCPFGSRQVLFQAGATPKIMLKVSKEGYIEQQREIDNSGNFGTVDISGKVIDKDSEAPIEWAEVEIIAGANYTSTTTSAGGTYNITAIVPGGSGDRQVDNFDFELKAIVIYTISVSASPAELPADGKNQSIVTAIVTNASGPVKGDTVTFTLSNTSLGTINPPSNTTNDEGVATTNFTAGTTAGTVTITATESQVGASDSVDITLTPVKLVVEITSPPKNFIAQKGENVVIRARVTDDLGNIVNGSTIDSVMANVTVCNETVCKSTVYELYDDGVHEDGAKDDGVYATTSWTPAEIGDCTIIVTAKLTGYEDGVAKVTGQIIKKPVLEILSSFKGVHPYKYKNGKDAPVFQRGVEKPQFEIKGLTGVSSGYELKVVIEEPKGRGEYAVVKNLTISAGWEGDKVLSEWDYSTDSGKRDKKNIPIGVYKAQAQLVNKTTQDIVQQCDTKEFYIIFDWDSTKKDFITSDNAYSFYNYPYYLPFGYGGRVYKLHIYNERIWRQALTQLSNLKTVAFRNIDLTNRESVAKALGDMTFIDNHLQYPDPIDDYWPGKNNLWKDNLRALDEGTGTCEDQSALSIGFLRAVGIPARMVHADGEGGLHPEYRDMNHAFVEARYSGNWHWFDPTNVAGASAGSVGSTEYTKTGVQFRPAGARSFNWGYWALTSSSVPGNTPPENIYKRYNYNLDVVDLRFDKETTGYKPGDMMKIEIDVYNDRYLYFPEPSYLEIMIQSEVPTITTLPEVKVADKIIPYNTITKTVTATAPSDKKTIVGYFSKRIELIPQYIVVRPYTLYNDKRAYTTTSTYTKKIPGYSISSIYSIDVDGTKKTFQRFNGTFFETNLSDEKAYIKDGYVWDNLPVNIELYSEVNLGRNYSKTIVTIENPDSEPHVYTFSMPVYGFGDATYVPAIGTITSNTTLNVEASHIITYNQSSDEDNNVSVYEFSKAAKIKAVEIFEHGGIELIKADACWNMTLPPGSSYEFSVYSSTRPANITAPFNDNTCANATPLTLDVATQDAINPIGDVGDMDWWRVNTTYGGDLEVNLSGPAGQNFDLYLYDSCDATEPLCAPHEPDANETCILSVNPGTYYIKIEGCGDSTGYYEVHGSEILRSSSSNQNQAQLSVLEQGKNSSNKYKTEFATHTHTMANAGFDFSEIHTTFAKEIVDNGDSLLNLRINAPTGVRVGETIPINLTVSNTGIEEEMMNLSLNVSRTPLYSRTPGIIYTNTTTISVSPLTEKSLTVYIPQNTSIGIWDVNVGTDKGIGAKAAFAVEDAFNLNCTQNITIIQHSPFTFNASITNTWDVPVHDVNVTINRFYSFNTSEPVEKDIGTLLPGESRTISWQLNATSSGKLPIEVLVTSDDGGSDIVRTTITSLSPPVLWIPNVITHTSAPDFGTSKTVSMNVTIQNLGDFTANNVQVQLILPENVTSTALTHDIGDLLGGEQKNVSIDITFTTQKDFAFDVVAKDDANHSAIGTMMMSFSAITLPDLTLTSDNIQVIFNENIATISATINNIGGTDTSNIVVQFFDGNPDAGGTQIGTDQTIASIAHESTGTAQVLWTAIPGTHGIFVRVDPYDTVLEYREDNNQAYKQITVSGVKTIHVDDDFTDDPANHKWNTIQGGINDANDGDTVLVYNGTYNENVVLNKTLTLIGDGMPEIDAQSLGDAINITADNCTVKGFICVNAQPSPYAGIRVDSSNNVIVENTCRDNYEGIYLLGSSNEIRNNIAKNNQHYGIRLQVSDDNIIMDNTAKGNGASGIRLKASDCNRIIDNYASNSVKYHGISVSASNNNEVRNNVANSNHQVGIGLRSSCDNIIAKNTAKSNGNTGIYLKESNDNGIADNDVSNNVNGISLKLSNNNDIRDNTANTNGKDGIYLNLSNENRITGNAASNNVKYHGISLKSSNNNDIRNNIADSNHYDGIKLRNSTDNIISNNTVKNNEDDGISLTNSNNNRIYMNNFMDNDNNVYSEDSTNIWHSTSERTYRFNGNTHTNYLGNYWDDYTGSDTDNDGIGDISYNINSDNDNYPLKEPVENYFLPIRLDSWK